MAVYSFRAMNQQGQEVKDQVEANSSDEALTKIRSMGYYPTHIEAKGATKAGGFLSMKPTGPKRGKTLFSLGRASNKTKTLFTRQLSTLQDAGLPIVRSIKILEGQQKPGGLKNALIDVTDDVESGSSFSEALAKHPKIFDRLYVNMVRAGEAGGVLDTILRRLADFMEKAEHLKKKVVGAMIYPIAVVTIAVGIVTFIMLKIIPKFAKIFLDMGVALPPLTVFLIDTAEWIGQWWPVVLISPIVFFIILKIIRLFKIGNFILDMVLLKLPLFGAIISKSAIARFARTLGTLITSGVPILEAINITRETSGNMVIARALGRIHDSIREGETIAEPLRESKVCDDMVVNMVDVGEETGELDRMLIKVADVYDEDVDNLVAALVTVMEPIIVIVLGAVVGTIVIALFMPLLAIIGELGSK
jgi:type IV pilus assembly protein PilC